MSLDAPVDNKLNEFSLHLTPPDEVSSAKYYGAVKKLKESSTYQTALSKAFRNLANDPDNLSDAADKLFYKVESSSFFEGKSKARRIASLMYEFGDDAELGRRFRRVFEGVHGKKAHEMATRETLRRRGSKYV